MARYKPKHRKRRRLADHRRSAGVFGLLAACAMSISGSFGYVPGAVAADPANPLLGPVGSVAIGLPTGLASSPARTLAPIATVAPALEPTTARVPTYFSIPAIGAGGELISLGLDADGALEVPVDFNQAGWYRNGVAPGERGPAIIAGHLDSFAGPAIFARLNQLKWGDLIGVARRDGTRLTFEVTRVDEYPKDYFPTDQVYGDTAEPELRLITCGGPFDAKRSTYRDNTVVYARLVATLA